MSRVVSFIHDQKVFEHVRAADTVANGVGIICFSHIFIPVYRHQSSPLMTRMSKEKKKSFYSILTGSDAHGADPCAVSVTTTVETLETKRGVNDFHNEGMTSMCPAVENRGSHTLATQENRGKTSGNHRPNKFLSVYLWQDAPYPRYSHVLLSHLGEKSSLSNMFLIDHLDSVRPIYQNPDRPPTALHICRGTSDINTNQATQRSTQPGLTVAFLTGRRHFVCCIRSDMIISLP